jgi:hypothetical protein
MAYSQGGLIAASDYNTFVGSNNTTTGTLNYVWSTGNGQYGYGQTGVSAVSGAGLVTATQWASMINTMNSVSKHQSGGSGTGLTVPTAGTLVSYLSAISGNISTYNTNHLLFNSTQGTTTTGSVYSPNFTATNGAATQTFTITRTATFSSGDAARYFFNSGGQLNFIITSTTNGDSTSRSGDLVTLLSTNFGSYTAFRATTGGGRSGTGGTLNTNSTSIGYYSLTTSNQTLTQITSTTTSYTSDYVIFAVKSNGVQGSNADVGTIITFTMTIYSAARTDGTPNSGGSYFNDTINITPNHRVDIVYPETTNLSNTWGTVTIA